MSSLTSSTSSCTPTRSPSAAPTILDGKYRLRGTLGAGGMGIVYDGENIAIGRRVAVKLLHPRYARYPELVERFEREARAAARIGHPNIVDVLDMGRADGVPYIVMEHLEGEVLYDRIARGNLAPADAIALLLQILDALAAAHAAGIVHRDLKPENVFVARRVDGGELAKILDFGVAKFSDAGQDARLTVDGFVVGTPSYMSPEQAAGLPSVDERTDVYSAGVLLYEVLSGRLPHEGTDPSRLLRAIISRSPPPLDEIAPWVPAPLALVVGKAMARAPEDRYQSAAAFLAALALLAEDASSATPLFLSSGSLRRPTPDRPLAMASTCTAPRPGLSFDREPSLTNVTAVVVRRTLRRRAYATIASVGGLVLGLTMFHHVGDGLDHTALALTASQEPAAQRPAAPVATVPLSITSNVPGARVLLDGQSVGQTPMERTLTRSDDAHLVRLEADGHTSSEQWIRADTARHVDLTLAPSTTTTLRKAPARRARSVARRLPFERVY
jgi:eukaryotic-like serine/threonine-protein kinase